MAPHLHAVDAQGGPRDTPQLSLAAALELSCAYSEAIIALHNLAFKITEHVGPGDSYATAARADGDHYSELFAMIKRHGLSASHHAAKMKARAIVNLRRLGFEVSLAEVANDAGP